MAVGRKDGKTKKTLLSSLLQRCSKLISSHLLCFSKLLSPLRSSLLFCRVDVAPLPSPARDFSKPRKISFDSRNPEESGYFSFIFSEIFVLFAVLVLVWLLSVP
ncbi:hypothetical protein ACOSQ3_033600 [Xanthoceras sorbifolium]